MRHTAHESEEKSDLGMNVGTKQVNLNVSITIVTMVYREWCEKQKTSRK